MSVSLSAERDRIQRQVEQLEQSLSATHAELELLSSETDDGSDEDSEEATQSAAELLAQREKIQQEIQNLENVLGPHSPICVSDGDSSSEESELDLSPSVDSCLQMNLVYQQVVQETLEQLETLLTHNQRQQKELMSHLSGPIKESSRDQPAPSSCQQPVHMYMGRFLKPYFKDKLTGLGPPANQEAKEKASRMIGCLDDKKLKVKRWESWQKTLLIHSVSRDSLRRLVQPKLSRMDYLTQKLSSAAETDRQQLREQTDSLEREIDLLRGKKEEELIGDRYDEHDWQKISNIDFEGTRDAEDIRRFWQNFLHPSINKSGWSQEEVQQLKDVSRRHGERHWESIAAELGTGRTAFLCLQTFQRFVSDSLKHGSWNKFEDDQLRELVDKMRIGNFIPYTQMSYFMEGRDPAQLIYRWNQVLDPSLKKGFWTKEEDQLLLQAVSRCGEKDWWKIRFEVPGRTDGSCRDRYYDCLKAGTKRGAFDQQEKELLLQLVDKHGVGRWAKIAAEIPHRNDAQCLREWRKVNQAAKAQSAQKPPKSPRGGKTKGKRDAVRAKKQIRRRLKEIKEDSSEDEGTVVEYMDSDEEEKKNEGAEVQEIEEVEEVEEEVEYTFPLMQEWIPVEKAQSVTFLSFRPVELPSSGGAHSSTDPVRSTVLGQHGLSVIIGPTPKEVQWEERHSSRTMMMVSPDQLRAYLHRQVHTSSNRSSGPQRRVDKQNPMGRMMDKRLGYELQAAVTPWIGNLLIPAKNRLTAADALREQGEKTQLPSTPVFLLLLQTMNIDALGCKEMIEQRKKRVVPVTPPPCPSAVRKKNTVAAILQRRSDLKEAQHEFNVQHKLILKQLQVLQQQEKKEQQLMLQQPPPPRLLSVPTQDRPGVLLPMRPNMHPLMSPQMSPMSFPQAVFIPHPVTQPRSPSIQLMPPPARVVRSPLPAHPAPHRLSVPPVPVVPMPLNTTSSCSASFRQEAVPLTQNCAVTLPSQHAAPSSVPATCPAPSSSSSTSSSPKWRGQKSAVDQSGMDLSAVSNGVVGAQTGVEGASDGAIKGGRRIRKPSQKAKALQDATEAKAEAKKKDASSPGKRVQIQNTHSPPQTVVPVPPQTVVPVPPQTVVPVPPQTVVPVPSQTVVPVPSQTVVPVPHQTVVPVPGLFPSDHSYTLFTLCPTPSQLGSESIQPSRDSASNKPPKARPSKRKRGRAEEQPSVTSSQDDRCLSGAQTGVDGASDGAIKGRRIRKPSQKAKALQDATEAKAEAKKKDASSPGKRVQIQNTHSPPQTVVNAKKKRTSSSPLKKRSRTSHPKDKVVSQNQAVAQLPGIRLLAGQSMWVMTPGGLVQLAGAPTAPLPAPPGNILNHQPATPPLRSHCSPQLIAPHPPAAVFVPVNLPALNLPRPLPGAGTCLKPRLQPVSNPGSSPLPSRLPQPPPKLFLPYKGTVRADPMAPPPLRREALQFEPSLMFPESQEAVRDWLSGRGGVVVPGASVALPYLPPFVSSLSSLSALLRAKKSLTKSSLQLLSEGSQPRCRTTKPGPDRCTERTTGQPPEDLPDSTSDLRPAEGTPAPSVSSDLLQQEEEEEAELVAVARQLVVERFSSNPAYQLLKARFLSCFTVPALLATVQLTVEKTVADPANEEEEKEEEELKKIRERGRRRKTERSLLCDGSGAPANHFSGLNTNTPGPDQTGPVETSQSLSCETTDLNV